MWRRIAETLGVYKVYEFLLEREVRKGAIPIHVAFILDGNRRWAKEHGFPQWLGHEFGADKVEDVLEWCYDLGISIVTLYVLSTENIKNRPREELEHIFDLLDRKIDEVESSGKLRKREVRVKVIGDTSLLPESLREKIEKLERKTLQYNKRFLNIALAYGGRREIVDAVKKISREICAGKLSVDEVDEDVFARYLYTGDIPYPEPDLVIRTSGELRISNFLLYQIAYSELVFLDVYWPDFRKIDLLRAVRTYQSRKRRWGG
ncbi:MAG: di-trans,poly-cis-decaprenylcistransferase [Thermofilum sp.]|jgi:tritrans,polycis-undecaprenyl-diphosphate synthase [geranylgeranyl-diphosphate specific]|nr:di-trans,poly-cis-decaprenylcistransferase [Thermofilum sp.]